MTITNALARNTVVGNGTTGPYTTGIEVKDATQYVVNQIDSNGDATLLVKDTDYTVSTDLTTITTTSTIPATDTLLFTKSISKTQSTDFKNNGTLDVETLEAALDKLTLIAHELSDNEVRVITQAITSTIEGVTIPDPGAGEYLKWNAAGTNLETGTLSGTVGITAVQDDLSPVLGGNLDTVTFSITATSDVILAPSGTNSVLINGSADQGALLKLAEDTDNGTNTVGLQAPSSIASDFVITLPSSQGTAGELLIQGASGLEFSNSGAGRVLLDTQTASASSAVTLTTGIDSSYDIYEIEVIDYIAATDGTSILVRTSTNGGSSYDAGASDYTYVERSSGTNGTTTTNNSTGANGISVFTDAFANNSYPTNIKFRFRSPDAANRFILEWQGSAEGDNGSTTRGFEFSGTGVRQASADVDAIRFAASSGNITSGVFKLYGVV